MEKLASDRVHDIASRSGASLALNAKAPAGTGDQDGDIFADPVNDTFVATTPTAASVPVYKRRWFIVTAVIGALLGIALLFIILFPVLKAIIQDIVNKTTLDITTIAITNPTNTSFQLLTQGIVAHTGIFSAVISFPTPVNVSWLDGSTKVPLGYMPMSPLYAQNKRATINDTTTFYITDQDAFGRFTSAMITSQNFTWQLENYDLTVQAGKAPTAHGISFNKLVTINGVNNFAGNVQLESLQLSGYNPAQSINFTTVTQVNNLSPFTLNLGTAVFDLSYQGVYLGNGTDSNANLSPGYSNITLSGALVPQTTASGLAAVLQLFASYINHQNASVLVTGKSTVQSDGTTISWLSQGFQSLTLTVPFQTPTPINAIRSIDIAGLHDRFSEESN